MELTNDNLIEWLKELDRLCDEIEYPHLSCSFTNEEWLRDYIGCEAQEVLNDELAYGE